ncbi:MAG: aminotransferase class V-fold PLP-dependent enzyme [Deltaproteobacteria bacterium]|nr:aminotransferase class V-fold PLP-dependent enzyme [Deltaproteobacteria bacterium]MBT6488206.1 aminotransferase class V-fold PLP-dependent enzyme [Deltaproteobacteria bacterium]
MAGPIYMDSHATTPVDPRVLTIMLPYFTERFGNAASKNHAYGWAAEKATDAARSHVATMIGAEATEIVFTSGATEANNLAILGVAERYKSKGRHIISQATEHSAVMDPLRVLETQGYDVTILPVDAHGHIRINDLREAIREDTILCSIMAANNEVGTRMPVAEIGEICHERGVLFHSDAVQACGRLDIDVQKLNIDLLSLSAHKIYGPKGIGALYVRRKGPRVSLVPQIHGGGHERGFRSGTLNVPGIVGLGEACRLVTEDLEKDVKRISLLTSQLADGIQGLVPSAQINGPTENRLPGNWNISIQGVGAERLMLSMRDLAISSGAACATAQTGPSHVLKAMGHTDERCHGSLRFGIGRFNTENEVSLATQMVAKAYAQLSQKPA